MKRRTVLSMLAALAVQVPSKAPTLRVAIIGDWGAGNKTQRAVAQALLEVHRETPLQAVVSTGDNIYPQGVESIHDQHWKKFTDVYEDALLQLPWYAALGNHDWRGNVVAQQEFSAVHPSWHMPFRYYTATLGEYELSQNIIVIDTTSLLRGDETQLLWLKETLQTVKSPWVVGHHPLRSYGHYGDNSVLLKQLQGLFNTAEVPLYLCGHDHDLQLIQHPDDAFTCVVSGAGAATRETRKGEHSLFASSDPGFAILEWQQNSKTVSFFNKSVSKMYRHVLFT